MNSQYIISTLIPLIQEYPGIALLGVILALLLLYMSRATISIGNGDRHTTNHYYTDSDKN
jgi:hypothetical protein